MKDDLLSSSVIADVELQSAELQNHFQEYHTKIVEAYPLWDSAALIAKRSVTMKPSVCG